MSKEVDFVAKTPEVQVAQLFGALENQPNAELRVAFLLRVMKLVGSFAENMPVGSLQTAVTQDSHYLTLVSAMQQTDPVSMGLDPANAQIVAAMIRGRKEQARLIRAAGGAVSPKDAADLLGISRQGVSKRRQAGTLLGLQTGGNSFVFPAFQFAAPDLLPGFAETLKALPELDPWLKLAFFLNDNEALEGASPLEALRRNRLHDVLRAARVFGEQGPV